jgi:multiple sugar transport system substrate-binding protein
MAAQQPSTPSMTRRAVIGATLAAGATALLWPYTPRSRINVPKGRIELEYWEKWTGIEGVALQKVVKRFNESQDRIWVHLVPISDIASKAMVAIGGGDPPDIVGLYTYNIPGYAEARAVMPLDDSAAFRGAFADTPYLPGIRNLLTHQGRQWAGVNTCYTLAMYYNRALLRSVNHDPDKPPRTISELDALSEKLTVFNSDHTRIERAGFLPNIPPGWWSYFWPIMFGGHLYDKATDRATIASPEGVACFEWLARTARTFGPAATTAFANGYGRNIHSAQDPFISGAMAMMVQGPWLANFIRSVRPAGNLDYAAAPVPVADDIYNPDGPAGLLEADVLMIPRGCPHPREAFAFLLFMQRQDVQEELALAHCKPSPFATVSPDFYAKHPNPSIHAFDAIARSPRVQVLPRTTAWKPYADLINTAFDAVWLGADPRKTLTDVQARAQQLIDAAAARRKKQQQHALHPTPDIQHPTSVAEGPAR